FSEAAHEGSRKKLFEVDWGTPDWKMIQNLQNNIYQFSFAKTHEQLKAVTQALYDKDGKIIPFHEFQEIAKRINNEFATKHLLVEYNTAIGGAQMASRWTDFSQDPDYPNGTYRTVGD